MERLDVDLPHKPYPIHIGTQATELAIEAMQEYAGKIVLCDETVHLCLSEAFFPAVPQQDWLILPAGETTKSIREYQRCLDAMAERKLGRDCAVFALGGGVIGDLAGFVAASYLRGVNFYQIPTTLLAMVDSSVGGKTGINIDAGKNLVGAFWQPKAVYIDPEMLTSLAPREFAAGMAEVIKYGMLDDASLFCDLENIREQPLHPKHPLLPSVIQRCCAIKAKIVIADEQETARSGGRALLNLGHTFAHAIENVAGYGQYLHGEAVAVGLLMAARLSELLGSIARDEVDRVRRLLENNKLPVTLRQPLGTDALIQAMYRDKKVRSGKLRFVVMEKIGQAVTVDSVEEEQVRQLWQEFGAD